MLTPKSKFDDMTKEDLIDILNSIRQKEIDDKKDKDDYAKYLEAFRLAIYDNDDDRFRCACDLSTRRYQ